MVRRSLVSLVLVALCVSACATPPQQVADAGIVDVEDDTFKTYREYRTKQKKSIQLGSNDILGLAARIDRKTGATTIFVEMLFAYSTHLRRHYDRAANAQAEPLTFHKILSDGSCDRNRNCSRAEVFQIIIPEPALRQAPPSGYQFKIFATAAPELLITLEKPYIDSLFLKIDADRAKPPTQVSQKTAQ